MTLNRIFILSVILISLYFNSNTTGQKLSISGLTEKGLVNASGKVVVKNKYYRIYHSPENSVFIAVDAQYNFEILHDETGKIIAKNRALTFVAYNQGNYLVLKTGIQYGIYNFALQPITTNLYDEIKVNQKGITNLILVKKDRLWGLLNDKGEIIITPQYNSMDWGTNPKDNGVFYPTSNLFQVRRKYDEDSFYINEFNEIDYAATGANCCYRKTGLGVDYNARTTYFLQHIDKINGQGKTALGQTYEFSKDSAGNLAEAYKWYKTGWNENKTDLYSTLKLADFLNKNEAFVYYDKTINYIELYRTLAINYPRYYLYIADDFFSKKKQDSAFFYYSQVIQKTGYTDFSRIDANIGLAKIFYAKGDTKKAADHLSEAKKVAKSNNTEVFDYKLGDLSNLALAQDLLKYGQVVLYNGKKAMVLHTCAQGRALSNGDIIPPSAINFKILNEDPEQFMTKCWACSGTGTVIKTFKSDYTISYSTSEINTGSSISGDYIKTTTYTSPSTYEGTETCKVCLGRKKIVKK